MNLTKNEIEVMDVFWGVGRPLSRAELLHLSVDKSWQSNSVHILLNSLLKKGALREAGFVRSGKTYGRTFEAALSCEEYCAATLCSSVKAGNLPALLKALLQVYNPDRAVLGPDGRGSEPETDHVPGWPMRSRRERVCFSFVPCFPEPNENKENIVIPFGLDWHAVQPFFCRVHLLVHPCGARRRVRPPEAPAEAAGRCWRLRRIRTSLKAGPDLPKRHRPRAF